MGIQAWSGLGSVKEIIMEKSHILSFVMLFEYPGQPHEVAIGALSLQGPITFTGSVAEKEVPKAPAVAPPTALCYSQRMTQVGLSCFGF